MGPISRPSCLISAPQLEPPAPGPAPANPADRGPCAQQQRPPAAGGSRATPWRCGVTRS